MKTTKKIVTERKKKFFETQTPVSFLLEQIRVYTKTISEIDEELKSRRKKNLMTEKHYEKIKELENYISFMKEQRENLIQMDLLSFLNLDSVSLEIAKAYYYDSQESLSYAYVTITSEMEDVDVNQIEEEDFYIEVIKCAVSSCRKTIHTMYKT